MGTAMIWQEAANYPAWSIILTYESVARGLSDND